MSVNSANNANLPVGYQAFYDNYVAELKTADADVAIPQINSGRVLTEFLRQSEGVANPTLEVSKGNPGNLSTFLETSGSFSMEDMMMALFHAGKAMRDANYTSRLADREAAMAYSQLSADQTRQAGTMTMIGGIVSATTNMASATISGVASGVALKGSHAPKAPADNQSSNTATGANTPITPVVDATNPQTQQAAAVNPAEANQATTVSQAEANQAPTVNQAEANQVKTNQATTVSQAEANQATTVSQAEANQATTVNQAEANQAEANQVKTNQVEANKTETNQAAADQVETNQTATKQAETNQATAKQDETKDAAANKAGSKDKTGKTDKKDKKDKTEEELALAYQNKMSRISTSLEQGARSASSFGQGADSIFKGMTDARRADATVLDAESRKASSKENEMAEFQSAANELLASVMDILKQINQGQSQANSKIYQNM